MTRLRAAGFWNPTNAYHVTIVPLLACDLGCAYCFQNTGLAPAGSARPPRLRSPAMTEETIRAAVAFVARQASEQSHDEAHVCLFGGEPLLRADICLGLLHELGRCLPLTASLITNATRLTPPVAEQLYAAGLRDIQITFDGDRASHDRVRVFRRDRSGTFDLVLDNLAAVQQAVPDLQFTVRINLFDANPDRTERALHEVSARLDTHKCAAALMPIDDIGIGFERTPERDESLVQSLVAGYLLADDLGFRISPSTRWCGYCSGVPSRGGAVIGPDGALFSCWDAVGRAELAVGDVRRGYRATRDCEARWRSCGFLSTQSPVDNWVGMVDQAIITRLVTRIESGKGEHVVVN
ncbi:MAG TPA: radical SAM protein [Solirubrobacteraceae bacterium]|nr:radical SAM protein [Solirubrobacteraceae bacterium]